VVLQQPDHTTVITAGTILTTSMAAFAFSRMRFRGPRRADVDGARRPDRPVPGADRPAVRGDGRVRARDTYWGIILPQLAAPIAVLVFKRGFDALPRELEESALVGRRVDVAHLLAHLDAAVAGHDRGGRHLHVRPRVEQLHLAVRGHERRLAVHDPRRARDRARPSYGALYAQQMAIAILGALPPPAGVRPLPAPDRPGHRQHRPQG
jgi:multiple sugar transport system permease protein